ncbi:MAG: ATP-binding protein, partial [Planctomycetota bacterium]
LGYAELAQMKGPAEGPVTDYLQVIHDSASRASELTQQLLLFSRGQPMDFMPFDLNRAVEDMLHMLRRVIGEDVAVEVDLGPDLWVARGDRSNLEQVVMNLIVNARDAMPRGGTLRIETRNKVLGEEEARDVPEVEPGRFVRLTVQDTGDGIEAELFDRIFEPFFTTKERGKGTGLGLSVAYGIVKKHGGWIRLESEPGRGSDFHVFLPASEAAAKKKRTTEIILEKILGRGERILLVEDQAGVREFACTALAENGYEVTAATSAEEAIAAFAANGGRFDLVFSDVVLPGLDGLELAERLTSIKPGIPILLNSGYTGDKVDPGEIQAAGHHFLRKPYTLTDLLRAIKKRITGADPLSVPGPPPATGQ